MNPSQHQVVFPLQLGTRDTYSHEELLLDCVDYLGWTVAQPVSRERFPSVWAKNQRGTVIHWCPFSNSDHSADLAAAAKLGVARLGSSISIAVHAPDRRVIQMPAGTDPQVSVRYMRVRLVSMLSERRRLRVQASPGRAEPHRMALPYYIEPGDTP